MKTSPYSIFLASLLAVSVRGQGPAGGPAARGGPGEGARPAPMERIMGGGDLEQSMLLRLLDNPRIAETIQLTDAQRKTLAAAFEPFDDQLKEVQPKLQEAIKVQTALLGELKPDEDKLMAAVDDVWGLRAEIAKIQTRKLMALRSHLTVDQINRAREMAEGFRQRAAGFQGRREGGQREGPDADRRRQAPEGGARGGVRGNRPPPAADAPRAPQVEL